ncbi:hypothetical protein Pmani_036090 [Petrolisthes manimaculis]|uniref:Uncharacterized protein n=1 Tax=Petrolisthes manimaculis TaxID=1843537 RepID=A0AAE1NJ73_9EUCA|nr:hypothetical protein Pmani_036090 [Petrolisthes manimaculis]
MEVNFVLVVVVVVMEVNIVLVVVMVVMEVNIVLVLVMESVHSGDHDAFFGPRHIEMAMRRVHLYTRVRTPTRHNEVVWQRE